MTELEDGELLVLQASGAMRVLQVRAESVDESLAAWVETHGSVEEVGVIKGEEPEKVVVRIDPKYFRPTEVDLLLGNPAKAKRVLGWTPSITFDGLVEDMMKHDLALIDQKSISYPKH